MVSNRVILLFLVLVVAMVALGLQFANRPKPTAELVVDDPEVVRTVPVTLYAYDARQDLDPSGNVACSDKGLVGVTRDVPDSDAAFRDTIALLLTDPLTEEERARGLTTEFPLPGVTLREARIDGDTAVIEFGDREHKLSGGSCRVSVMRAQLEKTAAQFEGVSHVRFIPDGVLEP